jgi:hypothetical protein
LAQNFIFKNYMNYVIVHRGSYAVYDQLHPMRVVEVYSGKCSRFYGVMCRVWEIDLIYLTVVIFGFNRSNSSCFGRIDLK